MRTKKKPDKSSLLNVVAGARNPLHLLVTAKDITAPLPPSKASILTAFREFLDKMASPVADATKGGCHG